MARPMSWCPRQMPSIGRGLVAPRCNEAWSIVFTFAAICGMAAGSPGPLLMTIPSGDHDRTSRAPAVAGNTRTSAPRSVRQRIWLSFTPVSSNAIFGPDPNWRAVPVASATSGRDWSGVAVRAFATASAAASGSCARCGGTCTSAPRIVPRERSRRTSARVSTPESPGTPCERRYASSSPVPSRQVEFSSRTTSASIQGTRDSAARSKTP